MVRMRLSLDINWLESLNQYFPVPDYTFLLNVNVEECIQRIESRGETKELFEKTEILNKVWKNYQDLAQKYKRVFMIDGERHQKEIANDIWEIIKKDEFYNFSCNVKS